jgi:hypothetical protein
MALVERLALVDGVLHCQFLMQGNQFKILEYTRRMSGDLFSKVVSYACGFRHQDVFVAAAQRAELQPLLRPYFPVFPFVARHCITAEMDGYFRGVAIQSSVRARLIDFQLVLPIGAPVWGGGKSKVAVVILAFASEAEMNKQIKNIRNELRCLVTA